MGHEHTHCDSRFINGDTIVQRQGLFFPWSSLYRHMERSDKARMVTGFRDYLEKFSKHTPIMLGSDGLKISYTFYPDVPREV